MPRKKRKNGYFETHDDFVDLKGPRKKSSWLGFSNYDPINILLPIVEKHLNISLQMVLSKILPTFNET